MELSNLGWVNEAGISSITEIEKFQSNDRICSGFTKGGNPLLYQPSYHNFDETHCNFQCCFQTLQFKKACFIMFLQSNFRTC